MKHSYVVVVTLFCIFISTKAGIVSKSRVVLCNQEKDVETSLDEENEEPTVNELPCKKKLIVTMTLRNAQVYYLQILRKVMKLFRQKQKLCMPISTEYMKKVLRT